MLLNYINRSAEQAKEVLMGFIAEKLPEMTDHTLSNPFIRMAHVWLAIQEQIHYYIDDIANEIFFPLARRYKSLIAHAYSRGYRIKNNYAASTDLTFYLDAPASTAITIPQFTEVTDENSNISYYTQSQVQIAIGDTSVNVLAKQESPTYDTVDIVGNGEPNQKFAVGYEVSEGSIEAVSVGGAIWTAVESLKFSTANDRHFVLTVNYDGTPCILFGDGATGLIPTSGEQIEVRFKTTLGFNGNIGAGTLTKIVLSPSQLLKVGNNKSGSGGKNIETASDIRRGLYSLTRTFGTAVTTQDLIDASLSYGGIVGANAKSIGDGFVDIYIVPTGGGVASSGLINGLKNYLNQIKVIGRELTIKSAGVLQLKLSLKATLEGNYTAISRKQLIENALLNFFSFENQKVGGQLRISDIYEKVENIEGVANSELLDLFVYPYAMPLNTLNSLNWSVKINDASITTKKWEVQYVGNNKYHLFKENEFMGMLSTDTTYSFDGIDISVASNSNYVVGNKWEFYSYKKFGSIDLAEQSVIVLEAQNLNIEI